ncbi:MarR family transcriptional regulator [Roseburia hominis]
MMKRFDPESIPKGIPYGHSAVSQGISPEQLPIQMLFHQVMHLQMQYTCKNMEQFKISPGQAGILFFLNLNGPLSQRELADWMHLKPPSVTVALKKMENGGLITRQPDEKDQRITRIRITDSGRDLVRSMFEQQQNIEGRLFRNMSAEEKMLLRRLVLQMRENILSDMKDMKMTADSCFGKKMMEEQLF